MTDTNMACREMTADEWAAKLIAQPDLTAKRLAIAIRAAEARARRHERDGCADLAHEYASSITEATVAKTRFGQNLDEQGQIDMACELSQAVGYVGVLISKRTPAPEKPLPL